MKKLLLSILILFAIQSARAQYHGDVLDKNVFISLGGEVGAPSSTPYNITYGGSATAEVKLINQLGLTLTAQYIGYKYKSDLLSADEKHPSFIPLKAGLKYYTAPSFYFQGEIGSTVQSNNNTSNMLVYSLGFGFEIPLDKHSDIDISFAYQNYAQGQYQTTGLRAAYRIGW